MKTIRLPKGLFALVDDKDYARVSKYHWGLLICGPNIYARRTDGKRPLLHRFILNLHSLSVEVDHRDRNGLNNQRENLRVATRRQNAANSKRYTNATTKYRGVIVRKRTGKFCAQIKIGGRNIYIGQFDSDKDAAKAYNREAVKHYGKFASLNEVM